MAKKKTTKKKFNSAGQGRLQDQGGRNNPYNPNNVNQIGQPKPTPQPQPGAPGGPPAMPQATYDSLYTSGVAGLDLAYNNALADITTSRNRLSFDTGYGADGAVDPRNPYSQASLLQKMWRENRSGTSINYAARGQLYSGARKSALGGVDYNYQRNDSALKENTRRGYEDLTTAEQRAGLERNVGLQQLGGEQAQRWQDATNEWWRMYG